MRSVTTVGAEAMAGERRQPGASRVERQLRRRAAEPADVDGEGGQSPSPMNLTTSPPACSIGAQTRSKYSFSSATTSGGDELEVERA